MVLPKTIFEASPLDPLLLLPLPTKLPQSPINDLEPITSALQTFISAPSSSISIIPIQILTAQMRQITRRSQILLNAARVGAAEARYALDGLDVDLRGVEYERDRVRAEIERCEDYAPAYKEMNLPDEETFLSGASEEFKNALPSREDETYEYALTIARLEQELREVEQREVLVAQLTKERDSLIRSKKEIKVKFDAVDVYLTDFARTTNAVASKIKDVASVTNPP